MYKDEYDKYTSILSILMDSLEKTVKLHSNEKADILSQLYSLIKYKNYNAITSQDGCRDIIEQYSNVDLLNSIMTTFYKGNDFDFKGINLISLECLNDSHKLIYTLNKFINNYYIDRDLMIKRDSVKNCRLDILANKQLVCKHNSYVLDGDMYAVMDYGKKRNNQEDSVLILKHPDNKEFKLMVLADGVGGSACGEKASQYIVSNMIEWFENLDHNLFYSEDMLRDIFNSKIESISEEILDKYPGSSSTFSGAIVGYEKTILSNVGDSRIYSYKDGELTRLTEDETLAQYMFMNNMYSPDVTSDDLRFMKESRAITNYVGEKLKVNETKIISNESYDTLLIFSDGVTDCITDDDIKDKTENTPVPLLAESIVNKALNNTIYSEKYDSTIDGGKDNASTIVYCKKRVIK